MQPGTSRDTDGVNAGPASESTLNPAQPLPPRLASRGGQTVRSRERGQSTAEFVVVLPFILLLFFLIVDFGWLLKNWIVVTNSARESARCTVAVSCQLNGADTTPSLLAEDRINAGITGNLTNVVVALEYIDADGVGGATAGDSVVVCASADNEWIGPIFGMLSWLTGSEPVPNPMPLRAREEMILERTPSYTIPLSDDSGACDFP
jgi:TadE-like protein